MRRRAGAWLLAAGRVAGAVRSRRRPACPPPAKSRQQQLLGLWRAEFEGLAQGATLLLEKHPEYAESVRGAINRNGERAPVAGDVDDGEFTLEESADGVQHQRHLARRSGRRLLRPRDPRHLEARRRTAKDAPTAFVLRKQCRCWGACA